MVNPLIRNEKVDIISLYTDPLTENFPPRIVSGPSIINVKVNTTAEVIVTAMDQNNESLSFTVTGNLPDGAEQMNTSSSITITWNVTSKEVWFTIFRFSACILFLECKEDAKIVFAIT